jgi:hypothetical protein
VLEGCGQIQLEQRVRTNAKGLGEVFEAMPRSRIALEIGTHSPWISRLLSELGHEVFVANARKVWLIGESRRKDDRLDPQNAGAAGPDRCRVAVYPVKHRSAQAHADLATRTKRLSRTWDAIRFVVDFRAAQRRRADGGRACRREESGYTRHAGGRSTEGRTLDLM